MEDSTSGAQPASAPSPLTGCYLLIIVGEPHSQEHKDIILQRIAKGLLSWNEDECHVNLEKELHIITTQASEGEEARQGERLIQYASENLVTEVLIHPTWSTLTQCVRNLLGSFTRHRHIIHAGYAFTSSGSWALQDGTFSRADLALSFRENDVQRVLRAYDGTVTINVHCAAEGDWSSMDREPWARHCKVRLNPTDVLTSGCQRIEEFVRYLEPMLVPTELDALLESSEVVGNIRFSHPTLYVFPGGQGDAALFGINGFNMLVDGGFSRKACFWDFVRHLDRLDAVLVTRINNSNVGGISAVLRRKRHTQVYPQIGHLFANIHERKATLSPDGDKDRDPLLIDLLDEGQEIVSNLRHIGLKPQPCYRDAEPINLYHKVGHGTLDMYILNPAKDSAEVKRFLQRWFANDRKLFAPPSSSKDFEFPLQNMISVCALLVWQPANPEEQITRILFPGSTPQNKIFEGLDKLKNVEFMKHSVCTAKTIGTINGVAKTRTAKTIMSALEDKKESALIENKTGKINGQVDNKKIQSDNKQRIIRSAQPKISALNGNDMKKSDSVESDRDESGGDNQNVVESENEINKSTNGKIEEEKPKQHKIKIEHKSKIDTKTKTKIDSKPAKSIDRKSTRSISDKKVDMKSSPTTPKKSLENKYNGITKEQSNKLASKSSPTETPAKSAKDANNRKVVESKYKPPLKKEVKKTAEKKPERKPISRRPKEISPSRKPPTSPAKSAKPRSEKDAVIRKLKLEKDVGTDSSTVSTPSVEQEPFKKLTPQEIEAIKAQELADLKEEQEVVKEIEAVFSKDEKRTTVPDEEAGTTEVEESEEYIIIEKEEVEQMTEDSINEIESAPKEDEIQKHTRDSEESEKKRRSSEDSDKGAILVNETEEKPVQEEQVELIEADSCKVLEIISPENKTQLKEEVQDIIESAKDIVNKREEPEISKEKTEEVSKELSSISPEDKLSSEKKTGDVKDVPDINCMIESQPEEKLTATVESGATTTAPTLPEDERITLPDDERIVLDEIKEDVLDQVVEEKHVKEETKEKEIVVSIEPTRFEPKELCTTGGIQLDTRQTHIRDIVKTPDEVADLPVHEEVDGTDDMYDEFANKKDAENGQKKEDEKKEKTAVASVENEVADATKKETSDICDKQLVSNETVSDLLEKDILLKGDVEMSEKNIEKQEELNKPTQDIKDVPGHAEESSDVKKVELETVVKKGDLQQLTSDGEKIHEDRKVEELDVSKETPKKEDIQTIDIEKEDHVEKEDETKEIKSITGYNVEEIVSLVAHVLKSDAPLPEIEPEVPFVESFIPFEPYTTELRETHITTVESPIRDNYTPETIVQGVVQKPHPDEKIVEEDDENIEEKVTTRSISNLMKESTELIQSNSQIVKDIKSIKEDVNNKSQDHEYKDAVRESMHNKLDELKALTTSLVGLDKKLSDIKTDLKEEEMEELLKNQITETHVETEEKKDKPMGLTLPDTDKVTDLPVLSPKTSTMKLLDEERYLYAAAEVPKTKVETNIKLKHDEADVTKPHLADTDFTLKPKEALSGKSTPDVEADVKLEKDVTKTDVTKAHELEKHLIDNDLILKPGLSKESLSGKSTPDVTKLESSLSTTKTDMSGKSTPEHLPTSDLKEPLSGISSPETHAHLQTEVKDSDLTVTEAITTEIHKDTKPEKAEIDSEETETKKYVEKVSPPLHEISAKDIDITNLPKEEEKLPLKETEVTKIPVESASQKSSIELSSDSNIETIKYVHDDKTTNNVLDTHTDEMGKGNLAQQLLSETEKHLSGHSTPDLLKEELIVKDLGKLSGKSTPDFTHEDLLIVDKEKEVISSEKSKQHEISPEKHEEKVICESKLSGKSSPETEKLTIDEHEKLTDKIKEHGIAEKVSTPDVAEEHISTEIKSELIKTDIFMTGNTTQNKEVCEEEKQASESTPDKVEEIKISEKEPTPEKDDDVKEKSTISEKTSLEIKEELLVDEKDQLSGKATPEKELTVSDKLSGQSTPDNTKEELTVIEKDKLSGKSTPEITREDLFSHVEEQKSGIDKPEKPKDLQLSEKDKQSGKSTPEVTKDDVKSHVEEQISVMITQKVEKSEIATLKKSEKATPEVTSEDLTTHSEEHVSEKVKPEVEKSGKATPEEKSEKAIPEIEKSRTTTSEVEKSGKSTPEIEIPEVTSKDLTTHDEEHMSGKGTPGIEKSGKTTPEVVISDEPTPEIEVSDKSTPELISKDLTTHAEENISGKVTPEIEKSGKTTPEIEKSGKATQEVEKSGKATPEVEKSGKATPDIEISEKTMPEVTSKDLSTHVEEHILGKVTLEVDNSGKATPEIEKSGKATPEIEISGKATPEVSSKDLTTHVEEHISGKATPEVEKSGKATPEVEKSGKATPEVEKSGKATPEIEISVKATPEVSSKDLTTHVEEHISGKATQDVEKSGKATPEVEKSGKATPEIEISVKATPEVSSKDLTTHVDEHISRKATQDVEKSGKATPEVEKSGKATPEIEISGKTTTEVSSKDFTIDVEEHISEKTTPEVEKSGKVTPEVEQLEKATSEIEISEKIMPEVTSKDLLTHVEEHISGKATPEVEKSENATPEVERLGKATPEIEISGKAIPEVSTHVEEQISGKATQVVEKSGKETPEVDKSGKITPEIEISGKAIPEVPSKDLTTHVEQHKSGMSTSEVVKSGKTTPEIEISGKTTPEVTLKDLTTHVEKHISGKATPDVEKSEKVTPEEKSEKVTPEIEKSEIATPDVISNELTTHLEVQISGKATPEVEKSGKATPEIEQSEKTSPEITSKDLTTKGEEHISGKITPEDEKSGKVTPEVTKEDLKTHVEEQKSGKTTPEVEKSGKATPEVFSKDLITHVEEQKSGKTTPEVAKSGKSTPEITKEDLTINVEEQTSGKTTPESTKEDKKESKDAKENIKKDEILSEKTIVDNVQVPELEQDKSGKSTPEEDKEIHEICDKVISQQRLPDISINTDSIKLSSFNYLYEITTAQYSSNLLQCQKTQLDPQSARDGDNLSPQHLSGRSTPEIKIDLDVDLPHEEDEFSQPAVSSSQTEKDATPGPSKLTETEHDHQIEDEIISGKSTPDIADVEKMKEIHEILKHEQQIPGRSTPPTAPISPIVKEEKVFVLHAEQEKIALSDTHVTLTEIKTTSIEHVAEKSEKITQEISEIYKEKHEITTEGKTETIIEDKKESSKEKCEETIHTLTEIEKTEKTSMTLKENAKETCTIQAETSSIKTTEEKTHLISGDETCSFQTSEEKSHLITEDIFSGVTSTELMSDDYEDVASPPSDLSSGQASRVPATWESSEERIGLSDDEEDIPGSPTSLSSQIARSPLETHAQKHLMEETHMADAMTMSFYGSLPSETSTPTKLKSEVSSSPEFERVSSHVKTQTKQSECIEHTNIQTTSKVNGQTDPTSGSSSQEQQHKDDDPISSWGKPLGLPSPAPPISDHSNKTTPKKEKKVSAMLLAKNKINDDRKRSDSPATKKSNRKTVSSPVYVDLAYVPHHGNSYYTQVDFFKRVRARYYVFSGTEPSKEVYNALLEGKQTWEDKELEVTIIPTYDTDVLGYWVAENEDLLTKYKIDLSPSASRCTINLQDHETSCSAYRLEF